MYSVRLKLHNNGTAKGVCMYSICEVFNPAELKVKYPQVIVPATKKDVFALLFHFHGYHQPS